MKQLFIKLKKTDSDIAKLEQGLGQVDGNITSKITSSLNTYKTEIVDVGDNAVRAKLTEEVAKLDKRINDLIIAGGAATDWSEVANKPFSTVDSTKFDVTGDNTLTIKNNLYATKAHELDNAIHVNSTDKANIGKITGMEASISALQSALSGQTQHYIKKTLAERDALTPTAKHGDICLVIDNSTTYILDKNDIDQDSVNPEWIKISDFETIGALVEWNTIQHKPFDNIDGTTIVKDGNNIKVKDNLYADKNHSHTVNWGDVQNKPANFVQAKDTASWQDDSATGLVYIAVAHNKNLPSPQVIVVGADKLDRLVGVEYVDNNNIKIWSDVKEAVTVTVLV